MNRHSQDDKFFIEARDQGTKEVLVIDRLSQEIILEGNIVKNCDLQWWSTDE